MYDCMYEHIHLCVHMNQMCPSIRYGIITDFLVLQHKKYTYAPDVAKHQIWQHCELIDDGYG